MQSEWSAVALFVFPMMATIEREMGVFDSGRVWPLGVSGSAMGVFGKWLRLQIDLLGSGSRTHLVLRPANALSHVRGRKKRKKKRRQGYTF